MKTWSRPLVAISAPIIGDLLVVITIEGKRAFAAPVSQFAYAKERAYELAADTKQPVKVSCLSFMEGLRFLGMTPADFVNGLSPASEAALIQLAIQTCINTAYRSKSAEERREAQEVLSCFGRMKMGKNSARV